MCRNDLCFRYISFTVSQVYIIQQDLSVLSQLVDKEAAILRDETHQCADTVSALRTEAMQLQETSRITEVVNSTRAGQIQVVGVY